MRQMKLAFLQQAYLELVHIQLHIYKCWGYNEGCFQSMWFFSFNVILNHVNVKNLSVPEC